MTRKICFLIMISCGLLIGCSKSNEVILKKSISKLNSLKSVEYQVSLQIQQKEMGLDEIDTAICYFNFTNKDSLVGAKFHLNFKNGEDVFDGKRLFMVDKKIERIIYTNEPKINQPLSSFFVSNSIYLIKKLMPEFLIDSSSTIIRQNDTLINGDKNYSFNISIKDRYRYQKLGAFPTEISGKTSIYRLFISKKSYLPTQFIYVLKNGGFWKSSFSNINFSATRADSIWDYDRFPQEYLRMSNKEFVESMKAKAFIRIGQNAPNWSLPLVSGNYIKLADLKGSLVLIEFWFPFCGGCVKSIPEINNIQDSYSSKNLKIFGIEFTQPDPKILADYIMKQKIEYPTLYLGQMVSKDYGVNAAPTFFLINKKGLIVYSSIGFNKNDLLKAINDNI